MRNRYTINLAVPYALFSETIPASLPRLTSSPQSLLFICIDLVSVFNPIEFETNIRLKGKLYNTFVVIPPHMGNNCPKGNNHFQMTLAELFGDLSTKLGLSTDQISALFPDHEVSEDIATAVKAKTDKLITIDAARGDKDLHKHFKAQVYSGFDAGFNDFIDSELTEFITPEKLEEINKNSSSLQRAKQTASTLAGMLKEAKDAKPSGQQTEAQKKLLQENKELRENIGKWEGKFKAAEATFEDERITDAIRRKLIGKKWASDDAEYVGYLSQKIVADAKEKAAFKRAETGEIVPFAKGMEGQPLYLSDQTKPATLDELVNSLSYPYEAKNGVKTAGQPNGTPGTPPSGGNDKVAAFLEKQRADISKSIN